MGTSNAEYGNQLSFAFPPPRGLTAILIPDCALLAARSVTGPLLFTKWLEGLEKIKKSQQHFCEMSRSLVK